MKAGFSTSNSAAGISRADSSRDWNPFQVRTNGHWYIDPAAFSRSVIRNPLVLPIAAVVVKADPPNYRQHPIEGAVDNFDVTYLPHRAVGDDWRNRWVTMNIHVPAKHAGPRPCIVFVHGGGYGAGDKDQNVKSDLLAAADSSTK